jgi:hypothetical protein
VNSGSHHRSPYSPRTAEEDQTAFADFENALNNTNEIELTTTGRTSGRESSRPVWFVRQGENLYLLPVTGSDSQWYKNVLKTPAIRLAAGSAAFARDSRSSNSASDANPVPVRALAESAPKVGAQGLDRL